MSVSEADRLLARGARITIAGEPQRVRFGFEALLLLEKEYEGLDVFYAKLMETGFGKTRIHTIFTGLVAGLLHTKPDEQDVEDFKRELKRTLEPKDMLEHLTALVLAFTEAIPELKADEAPKANGSRASSRGRTSTGTRRSAMDAPTVSSGA